MMAIIVTVLILTALAVILNTRSKQGVQIQKEDTHRKLFCIVASLLWIALSVLRHESIGADTLAYQRHYNNMLYVPFSDAWENFVNTYTTDVKSKDPGYNVLVKLLQLISKNDRFLLVFIAVLFFTAMGIWIYRYSQMPYVSFLLFSTLFYSFYAITGHRQTIATALVVFVGFEFMRKRQLLPYLLVGLVATTIHKSAWCYVPVYLIYPFKGYSRRTYLTLLLSTLFVMANLDSFWESVATWLGYNSMLDNEIGGTGTFVFFYFLAFSISMWRFPSIVSQDPDAYHTFNVLFVGSVMVMMAFLNQSFMRVQQYFTLYLMLLLPNIVTSFKGRERFIVGTIGCALLLFLMIRNDPDYIFFWQTINL